MRSYILLLLPIMSILIHRRRKTRSKRESCNLVQNTSSGILAFRRDRHAVRCR